MSQPLNAGPVVDIDTGKNRVLLYADSVHKTFKTARDAKRHARREIAALRRLEGLAGVPAVLSSSADHLTVVMSRLPGKPLAECEHPSERSMKALQQLVEQILRRGVARHSLPPRDVLIADDGSVGLVDFERSTRRLFPGDPAWLVAKAVMRFHLMRLVAQHAPQLLTERQQRRLRWQLALRASLQKPAKFRRRVARAIVNGRWA